MKQQTGIRTEYFGKSRLMWIGHPNGHVTIKCHDMALSGFESFKPLNWSVKLE